SGRHPREAAGNLGRRLLRICSGSYSVLSSMSRSTTPRLRRSRSTGSSSRLCDRGPRRRNRVQPPKRLANESSGSRVLGSSRPLTAGVVVPTEFLHRLRLPGSRLREFRDEDDLLDVRKERIEPFLDVPLELRPQPLRQVPG